MAQSAAPRERANETTTAVPRRSSSAWSLYLRDLPAITLSPEQEDAAARRAAEGDETAQDLLVQAHLRLVIHICQEFAQSREQLEELVAAGNVGLLRAARSRRFNPAFGIPFPRYAARWIHKYVNEELSRQVRPRHKLRRAADLHTIAKKARSLATSLGREVRPEEVAASIGTSAADVREALQSEEPALALDAPHSNSGQTAHDRTAGTGQVEEDATASAVQRTSHADALREQIIAAAERQGLTAREWQAVVWLSQLDADGRRPVVTLDGAAARHGITIEGERQLYRRALDKLAKDSALRSCGTW